MNKLQTGERDLLSLVRPDIQAPATHDFLSGGGEMGARIRYVLEHGTATWDEGLLLFLERSGFAEETYHTFSYSPVYDDQNRIAGMLCVVTEVTERVIGERRLRALRDLAARISGVETVQIACDRLIGVFQGYAFGRARRR